MVTNEFKKHQVWIYEDDAEYITDQFYNKVVQEYPELEKLKHTRTYAFLIHKLVQIQRGEIN